MGTTSRTHNLARHGYGFGIKTGYRYADGSAVKIGDLIVIPDYDGPGTIRMRPHEKSNSKPYITFGHHTMSVDDMPQFVRYTKPTYRNNLPVRQHTHGVIDYFGKGKHILGLEDYDHAIYVEI